MPRVDQRSYLSATMKNTFLDSYHMTRTHGSIRWLSGILFVFLSFIVCMLIWAPWQQTSSGLGQVVAFDPLERNQVLGAPIKGRVLKWYATEGSFVKKGELIAQMTDNDPMALNRIKRQIKAVQDQLSLTQSQANAYKKKIESLQKVKKLRIKANRLKIRMLTQKVKGEKQKYKALQAALKTANINLRRLTQLQKDEIISNRKLEIAQLKVVKLQTSVNATKADITIHRAAVVESQASLLKKSSEDQAKIDSAEADLQKTKNKAAYTRNELAKIELKLGRQASQKIFASRDSTVLKFLVTEGSEMLKQGDPLALIVPRASSFAVELWINGNDVALMTKGRKARLQFEGWPAIQFSGWPSMAVGTFGGEVAFVDVAKSKNGKFRVVIIPDQAEKKWPEAPLLRQGMKAKGWIFLNRVRLGFEVWRQLNGFPPGFERPIKLKERKPILKKLK